MNHKWIDDLPEPIRESIAGMNRQEIIEYAEEFERIAYTLRHAVSEFSPLNRRRLFGPESSGSGWN